MDDSGAEHSKISSHIALYFVLIDVVTTGCHNYSETLLPKMRLGGNILIDEVLSRCITHRLENSRPITATQQARCRLGVVTKGRYATFSLGDLSAD